MGTLRFWAIFLFSVFPLGASAGGESREPSERWQRAVALYEEGWGGDDAALLAALEVLGAMAESPNVEPVVRAYYGSAAVARARMVPDWQKGRWLRLGASELDAAVGMAEADVQIRLLRAVTFAILPRIAGRTETVREDFAWLVARAEGVAEDGGERSAGGDGEPGEAWWQAIFYHAGSFAMRERDPRAVIWLEKAEAIGAAGNMDLERVRRVLRLARTHFSLEDGN